MLISEAIANRKSIRAFLDTAVSDETLAELLTRASRAPSGGNVQPWRIYILNGDSMSRFKAHIANKTESETEKPEYHIYPKSLTEPYRSSRYKVGEDMYNLLDIPRDDKEARFARLMENYNFFGAPAAIFCFVDRQMGAPQWSDLGMFLQSFMLLALEQGLGTCAQEAWSMKAQTVAKFVDAPSELMLFCGVAIGHEDPDAPVNTLISEREPLDSFARFV